MCTMNISKKYTLKYKSGPPNIKSGRETNSGKPHITVRQPNSCSRDFPGGWHPLPSAHCWWGQWKLLGVSGPLPASPWLCQEFVSSREVVLPAPCPPSRGAMLRVWGWGPGVHMLEVLSSLCTWLPPRPPTTGTPSPVTPSHVPTSWCDHVTQLRGPPGQIHPQAPSSKPQVLM